MLQAPGTGSEDWKIRLALKRVSGRAFKTNPFPFTSARVGQDQPGARHRGPVGGWQEPGDGRLRGLKGRQEPRVHCRQKGTRLQNLKRKKKKKKRDEWNKHLEKSWVLVAAEQSDISTHQRRNLDRVLLRMSTLLFKTKNRERNSSRQQFHRPFHAFVNFGEKSLQLQGF